MRRLTTLALAAAFGLSALLLSSASAFNVVKYGGAAYLIYLGVKTLLTKENIELESSLQKTRLSRVFTQGVIVNVLNPKTALFFFAFLPQFVDPGRGAVAMQVILLGTILIFLGTLSDSIYALAAGTIGGRLRGNLTLLRAQRYFAGSGYIGLGAMTRHDRITQEVRARKIGDVGGDAGSRSEFDRKSGKQKRLCLKSRNSA